MTAEYYPYARTGGLAEAVSGLAQFQHAAGLNVAAIIPLYRTVRDVDPDLEPVGSPFTVPVGAAREEARIFRATGAPPDPQVYFIEHREYFYRPGIYGENAVDYPDNARRFAFFALAALSALPRLVKVALPPARPRLAHGTGAGVPAHAARYERFGGRGPDRHVDPQSGLPGPFSARGDARYRAPVGAVQLAAARVARQGQLAEGRARVRGLRHHRESHAGRGAPHAGWRLRPA